MFQSTEDNKDKGFVPKNRNRFGRNFSTFNRINREERAREEQPKLNKAEKLDSLPEYYNIKEEEQVAPVQVEEVQIQEEVYSNKDTQIPIDIKMSRKEYFYSFKRKFSYMEQLLEILPFWKNGITMFTFVFGIFTTGLTAYLILVNFQGLKNEVPLLYNQTLKSNVPVDKSILLLVPVIVGFFNFIIIRLSMMIFNFDRKLVITLNLALILFNTLLIIGLVQVLSLILS